LFCRHLPRDDGADLLLVGVVHDHPASIARVQHVVEAAAPDVLALELPPASLPLYRQFAASEDPTRGGEMSAAIATAEAAELVGIDPLDARFVRTLCRETIRDSPSPETVHVVARRTVGVAKRIARQRLAAANLCSDVDDRATYDCAGESLAEQVAHEAAYVEQCATLTQATVRPPVARISETARERRMAERLTDRSSGLVVAVVGWGHLDALVERLDA
jgi:pheromone shutdown protein TraB